MTEAKDWARTGRDCQLCAGADVDGDGLDDLTRMNGPKDLAANLTVAGSKASLKRAFTQDIPKDIVVILGLDPPFNPHT